ncbi:hypothetical protein ATK74_2834 [Propionicimonas paludicola]|uniref:DUF2200 family protein n=1 Tax=Propionicimonas paludicola TaxID=185243 RepID=A0A2A9CX93_9ACTN|nr:DUF2200 domain-containing protein [Propionicimonas paludicola]PFG18250.1 hypothetical protein ATK74_2834 [Propionicimonas paludicola]
MTHRIFGTPFSDIYQLYLAKVERKGHTQAELDQVISWLTGYDADGLARVLTERTTVGDFFDQAPSFNPHASLITGLICGIRVEEMDDPQMQRVRYLDKLVDEVARGKKMSSILRSPA